MAIEVTITGLEKWMTMMDPVRFTTEIDKALDRAASVIRDDTKRMPPVNAERTGYDVKGIPVAPLHGGTLRQSIQKRRAGLMAADVYTGVNYGGYVHDGTSKMPARPFFRWVLEDFGGMQKIDIIVKSALERVVNP